MMRAGLTLVVLVACCPPWLLAQGADDDSATASLLREARENAAAGRGAEALEQFQRIIDSAGDDLVPADEYAWTLARPVAGSAIVAAPRQLLGGRYRLPARWVCQREIAALPAAARAQYRKRVDGPARERLDVAKGRRDPALLERLLADAFCSTPAEEAIHLLAERALERGDFDRAGHYWRMLLPAVPGEGSGLTYPEPKSEPAAVRARLVLLELFRGDHDAARLGLAALGKDHPQATGRLAGRDGPFVETLQQQLARPEGLSPPEPADAGVSWPTFGGDPSRSSLYRGRLPYYWPERPAWRVPLPADRRAASAEHPRALAFHPVIWRDRVLVCDACRVWAFDARTGEPIKLFHVDGQDKAVLDIRLRLPLRNIDEKLPVVGDPRYTLTVAGDLVYVRLGVPVLRPPADARPAGEAEREGRSAILCLGPADGAPGRLGVWWLLAPPDEGGSGTLFEGTPLVVADRLYAATWRLAGGQGVSAIVCYDGAARSERPEVLWQRDIAKGSFDPTGEPRYRHELLTLAGDHIVFCPPGGPVVALDGRTGKPAWEFHYPRSQRRPDGAAARELGPCTADAGRVFVAPADADRVFCLDARTGRPQWESRQLEVIHLLGVARGRLIATLDRPLRGIVALDIKTGSDRPPGGWLQHDDGAATFGRGLLSPEVVLWPTRQGIQFLSVVDGGPLRTPVALRDELAAPHPLGNLGFADGCLVAATATELLGFVAERRQLEQRRKEAEVRPDDPELRLRLGLAEADAGNVEAARDAFRRSGASRPAAQLICARAEEAARARRFAEARRWLELLESETPGWRAFARARRGILEAAAGDEPAALAAWRSLVDSPELRTTFLADAAGVPRAAGALAAAEIARLTRTAPAPAGQRKQKVPKQADRALELPAPLRRLWQTNLRGGSYLLLETTEGGAYVHTESVFLTTGRSVACLSMAGEVQKLAALRHDAWCGTPCADGLVVAGPRGVSRVRRADGLVAWEWLVSEFAPLGPAGARLPLPSSELGEPGAVLSSFHINGSFLYCLLDRRLLVCLDLDTGQPAWVHFAGPGAFDLFSRFGAPYVAGESHLLVQLSDGRVRTLDAASGKAVAEVPGRLASGAGDPVCLASGQFVMADGPEAVVCRDPRRLDVIWKAPIGRPASRTGAAPRLLARGDELLVLVPRNHGFEVERLDPRTGHRVWTAPVFFPGEIVDRRSIGIDPERFYVAAAGVVRACTMSDGKSAWQAPLPGDPSQGWRVIVGKQALVIHPDRPVAGDRSTGLAVAGPGVVPLVDAVQKSYHAWMDRPFPLWLADPETGRWLQRLGFRARGGLVGVAAVPAGMTVVTGDEAWGLRTQPD